MPAGTRALAELGAEVVRVAPPVRGGPYIGIVDGVFLSKPCLGINLKNAGGLDLARRLVAQTDVVCHNFTPGVMAGFGLSPQDLLGIKPQLVVLQLSGYGTPGPWSEFPAFGPSTESAGGLNALTGWSTDPPVRAGSGVFGDQLAGRYAALALVAALERRRRTGKGQVIDLSMAEAVTTLLGPPMVEAWRTGRLPERLGNRHARFAPQGIYPCAGDDEWVAVTVTSDAAWAELVELTGARELADPTLATAAGRRARHDAIDTLLGQWTCQFEKDAVASLLQKHGVAAGPVRRVRDPLFDDHLRARQAFQMVPHEQPILGFLAHPHLRHPWVVEGRRRSHLSDYRQTGADNVKVLKRWLGLPGREVKRLVKEGALVDGGTLVVPAGAGQGRRDADFGEQLGLPPGESVE